jgi:hypothetical protein
MTTSVWPLRVGDQLASTVCTTRVVVVRAPSDASPVVACGGNPMIPADSAPRTEPDQREATTLLGKRYVNADETVEVLCVSPGAGELSCDGAPMSLKAAKPLPASD